LLAEAATGKAQVWFVDAAHFTMLTSLGYVWSVLVCWVRAMAGRKRHSVLGALNALTMKLITVTTDKTVNSETMKDLLLKLHATKTETCSKLVLILDNARYQHCAAVKELALELGISLEFLPGYSPHLNLIERVWKFIRKTALHNRFYNSLDGWAAAIDGCIDDMNSGVHDAALKKLLTWNFQTFDIDKIKV
jgi:transposase